MSRALVLALAGLAVVVTPLAGQEPEAKPLLRPVEWTGTAAKVGAGRWAVLVVADKYAANPTWDLESADRVVDRLRRALAKGLGIHGDRVVVLRGGDVTGPAIGRTLRQVGEGLRGQGNLVVWYYYGHGWTEAGGLRLFTRDTDVADGGSFLHTVSWEEVGRGFAGLCEAAARHKAEAKVVSIVDACRVRTQAPPGPASYVPLERVVAALFATKPGAFANEGVFCDAFSAALEAYSGREVTKLGDLFDATARKQAESGTGQEPELVQGERDLVLRRMDELTVEIEAWDPIGPGRRVEGGIVTLGAAKGPAPLAVTGLRPGYHDLRVECPGYLPRHVGLDLATEHGGRVLRVPLLPAVVVVAGEVAAPADAVVRVRLAAPRPEGTIDGYHVLAVERRGPGPFVLRLPALPPGLQLLVQAEGSPVVRVDVPAEPATVVGALRVPRHEVGRVAVGGPSPALPPSPPEPAPRPVQPSKPARPAMRFCGSCGAALSASAKFCGKCGWRVP